MRSSEDLFAFRTAVFQLQNNMSMSNGVKAISCIIIRIILIRNKTVRPVVFFYNLTDVFFRNIEHHS